MSIQSLAIACGALIVVLAMIGLASRLLRSAFGKHVPTGERSLFLRETLALDARRRVHLVRCGGRTFVLLTGGSQDILVGWVPDQ